MGTVSLRQELNGTESLPGIGNICLGTVLEQPDGTEFEQLDGTESLSLYTQVLDETCHILKRE